MGNIAFLQNKKHLKTSANFCKVFNESFGLVNSFQAHDHVIWRIKQSPFNNEYVATCSYDSQVKIWNANTNWTLIRNYTGHYDWVWG